LSFADKIEESKNELFPVLDKRYLRSILYWVINSKYRKSVKLSRWLASQLANPSERLLELVDLIPTYSKSDRQMSSIFRYLENTKGALEYVSDSNKWKRTEYWQTANETAELMTGDCEDGAILLYIIARLKGIHQSRLRIMAGKVQNPYSGKIEGHAYLAYRSAADPFHWKIMDWCYSPQLLSIQSRDSYYVSKDNIPYVFNNGEEYIKSIVYLEVWWGFNEQDVIKDFTYHIDY